MRVLVLCAALALATTGCAAFSNVSPDDGPGLHVVAAFYPLQFVTQRVAGTHADVASLTKPGKEPHDLELSVAQTAAVLSADVVVYEKGLQSAVDSAVDQTHDVAVIDAGEVAGLERREGHVDPHFWLDPLRMAKVADAVAAALAEADPEHAEDFRANAARLDGRLTALDREYADGLAGCARDTIVVSHDAFGYLARYGLIIEPISGLSPDAEPTPADLARLQQLIDDDGITTVFGERLVSPKLAESLANDMGVRSAVLDPIEGLSSDTSHDDYLSLMRDNLAALRDANGCP
jgi:zinc transport system substrate-binding protein